MTGRRIAALGVCASLCVCLGLGACVHSKATMLSHRDPSVIVPRHPVDKAGITYHEVALTKSRGGYTFSNEHSMLESAKMKPAHLGASDVFMGSERAQDKAPKVSHGILGTTGDRKGRSPAIVLYPAGPTHSSPPPSGSAQ